MRDRRIVGTTGQNNAEIERPHFDVVAMSEQRFRVGSYWYVVDDRAIRAAVVDHPELVIACEELAMFFTNRRACRSKLTIGIAPDHKLRFWQYDDFPFVYSRSNH